MQYHQHHHSAPQPRINRDNQLWLAVQALMAANRQTRVAIAAEPGYNDIREKLDASWALADRVLQDHGTFNSHTNGNN